MFITAENQTEEQEWEFIPALRICSPFCPWYLIFVGGALCPIRLLNTRPVPPGPSKIHTCLPKKTSRNRKLINTALPIITPLGSGRGKGGSWHSKLHTLAFILEPKTLETSTIAADCFLLFIVLHRKLMASEDMQHKEFLSTATTRNQEHFKNSSKI